MSTSIKVILFFHFDLSFTNFENWISMHNDNTLKILMKLDMYTQNSIKNKIGTPLFVFAELVSYFKWKKKLFRGVHDCVCIFRCDRALLKLYLPMNLPVRPSAHLSFYTVLPKITSRDAKINSVVWSPVCSHCPLLCLRLIYITCLLNYFCSFKYQSAYSWSPYCLTKQSWSP